MVSWREYQRAVRSAMITALPFHALLSAIAASLAVSVTTFAR